MTDIARRMWAEQDRHRGDRWRLFTAVGGAVGADRVLYPGSYVDLAPSFVFPSVTYVDTDDRAAAFFDDREGIDAIIGQYANDHVDREVRFIHGDYTESLDIPTEGIDLLVSLYAGFVSESCTEYLRTGGTLLVNASHGDAAMASIDDRYRLVAVVRARSGEYQISTNHLENHLVPKKPIEVTAEYLHARQRGIAYVTAPFAYLFERVQ